MILVCSACGRPPVARIVETAPDEHGFRTVEKVPDHCPNPQCEYHDRVDNDWLVEREA
jgi:NADPH-dependent ferric siderophore reductase